MTGPDPFSIVVEGKTYEVASSLSSPRYSTERFVTAVGKVLPEWGESAPCLVFLLSEEVILFAFLVDVEDRDRYSVRMLDAVDLSRVNLTLDPRKIPARVGGRSYSAKNDRSWDVVLLLCAFDMLSREESLEDGRYTLWDAVDVDVELMRQVYRKDDGTLGSDELVMVTGLSGPPVKYETEVWI